MLTVPTFWIVLLYLTCTSAVDLKHNKLPVRLTDVYFWSVGRTSNAIPSRCILWTTHLYKVAFGPVFPPDWWKNNVSPQMLHLYKQWSAMPSERPFCKKQTKKNIGRTKALTAWKTHKQNTLVDTTGLQSGCFISFRLRDSSILLLYDLPPTKKKKLLSPCAWAHPFMTSSLYEYFGVLLELQLKSFLICISPVHCDVNPYPAVG